MNRYMHAYIHTYMCACKYTCVFIYVSLSWDDRKRTEPRVKRPEAMVLVLPPGPQTLVRTHVCLSLKGDVLDQMIFLIFFHPKTLNIYREEVRYICSPPRSPTQLSLAGIVPYFINKPTQTSAFDRLLSPSTLAILLLDSNSGQNLSFSHFFPYVQYINEGRY